MSASENSARNTRREKRLPGRLFGAVRLCGRSCLIDANGNEQRAIELVEQRMESIVGSVFLSIAIQVAIKLIMWWIENRITEPSVVAQVGEPGTNDEDIDEWDEA